MKWTDIWPPNWGRLVEEVQNLPPWVSITGTAVVGLVVLAVLILSVASSIRLVRGKDSDAKARIGFALVQAGVSYIVITGGFEFFHRVLTMPSIEAGILALIIEAATWSAVGTVYTYGRSKVLDRKTGTMVDSTGFGPGGPFFWFTVTGGGTLAILGSDGSTVALGRAIIVALGAYMWYLKLLAATRRPGTPSRWNWTPHKLLLAIGAKTSTKEDVPQEEDELQVIRAARAIRWSNSSQPWKWLGRRSLIKVTERASEGVLAAAQRRVAATHVLREQTSPDSAAMQSIMTSVQLSMARLHGVDDEIADTVEDAAAVAVAGLTDRLAIVENLIKTMAAPPVPAVAELTDRLATIEDRIKALAAPPVSAPTSGQVGTLPAGHMSTLPAGRWAEVPAGHTGMMPAGHTSTVPAAVPGLVPAQAARVGSAGRLTARIEGPGQSPESDLEHDSLRPVSGAPSGGKLTREEALEQFGEQLVAEWLATPGQGITPYRVRKVCGLAQRPGEWVWGQVKERAERRPTADRHDAEDDGSPAGEPLDQQATEETGDSGPGYRELIDQR